MQNSERQERQERPKRKASEDAIQNIRDIHAYYTSSNNPLHVIKSYTPPDDMDYANACKKQKDSSNSNGGKHPKGSGYHYERNK